MADIPDYHTTPVQAAESATEAGVPLLLLYHLNPPPPNPIAARVFLRGVSAIRKDGVLLARDGMLIAQIGSASCRESGCKYVSISVGAVSLTTKINNTAT